MKPWAVPKNCVCAKIANNSEPPGAKQPFYDENCALTGLSTPDKARFRALDAFFVPMGSGENGLFSEIVVLLYCLINDTQLWIRITSENRYTGCRER